MSNNFLKLNINLSEVLLIGPKSKFSITPRSPFLSMTVRFTSPQIKSLGVMFDSTLSFIPQINNISRTAFLHLQNIARLRPSLSQHSSHYLLHKFTSWSPPILITIMPSSLVFLINFVSKSSRTLLPGSSPTPSSSSTHCITPPSSSSTGFLFNNGLTTKFYC
ncbi:hypothetical protein LDENG_00275110 [Lucifuga dentata]|nr:hypothetical protein LDENG_00275110 [Lucifuga dentata]